MAQHSRLTFNFYCWCFFPIPLYSTAWALSLLLSVNEWISAFIILSKNNWSLLPLYSPCLCNQLPLSLRQPHSGTSSSISYSPIPSPITSFSSDSSLCTSITPSLFHSRLKTYLFHKSYHSSFTSSSRTAYMDFCLDRFFWATRFLVFIFSSFCSFLGRALD